MKLTQKLNLLTDLYLSLYFCSRFEAKFDEMNSTEVPMEVAHQADPGSMAMVQQDQTSYGLPDLASSLSHEAAASQSGEPPILSRLIPTLQAES